MTEEKDFFVWQHNKEKTAAAVINQERYDSVTNSYGGNDFVLEFLKETGLWGTLINSQALDLKKENGHDPEKLNAIMTIKELVGIKRISNSGLLFSDVTLMSQLGFNLEEVIGLSEKEQGVVSKSTLWNHCNRIPVEETYRAFYEHVYFLKKKKLLRGGIYAVDGYELEITVNNEDSDYEDAGRVWSKKENRWKYGYKLLFLVNITEGRERIVGFYLDRIEVNEVKLFQKLKAHLEKYVCPLEVIVKQLVMDRAYWDETLLKGLAKKGIIFLTLGKENLCLVKDYLRGLISRGELVFKKYQLKNKKYYQRKTDWELKKSSKEPARIETELALVKQVNYQGTGSGDLNVVVRRVKREHALNFSSLNLQKGTSATSFVSVLQQNFELNVKTKSEADLLRAIDTFIKNVSFEKNALAQIKQLGLHEADVIKAAVLLGESKEHYQGKLSIAEKNERFIKRLEALAILYPDKINLLKSDGQYVYIFYVTNKKVKNLAKIVESYGDRNIIENNVNRELDQRWFIRSLNGRTLCSMSVRIAMILKLFNCEKVLKMKHPKYHEEVKKRQRAKENHSFLQEVDIAVYILDADYFGIFKASEFALLIKERTKKALTLKLEAKGQSTLSLDEVRNMINEL